MHNKNILNRVKYKSFSKICSLVHRTHQIKFSQFRNHWQTYPSTETVTLILEGLPGFNFLRKSCNITAYSCEQLIPETSNSIISNIKIAAGIKPSSILVLKKKENSSKYECIEIINDLDIESFEKYERN